MEKKWNRTEDADLFFRLAHCGVVCGFTNKKLVYQIPRPGNNTTGFTGAKNDYDQYYNQNLNIEK